MKSAAIDANLDTGHKKLTNHAVRKTNVGRLVLVITWFVGLLRINCPRKI